MGAVMFQGTGSDVGKSLIVAGLARALTRRGLRVRPFKPQNMANNAAVTVEGGEIGRAQALQARAAGVAPSIHMNPVLLKPQSDTGAQIIVRGQRQGSASARDYQAAKGALLPMVLESFAALKAQADIVLVEGAGSASEVNLRAGDIANMGFARAADVPVVVVGDIDRGGVIASLVGTRCVIDPEDAAKVRGYVVNRMRGDKSLFADGLATITQRTGWPCLGLIPHFAPAHRLPAEDSLALMDRDRRPTAKHGQVRIAVPLTPRIANFDDIDPLRLDPCVDLVLVEPGAPIPVCDLVLLPGSKTTIPDLAFLRGEGWDVDIIAHARRGGHVLGLCGGYQMLGRRIADPQGIEGAAIAVRGLCLLDVVTDLSPEKTVRPVSGQTVADGVPLSGYEIHNGVTLGPDTTRPLVRLADGASDGAMSASGRVAGTYVHGFFGDDRQRSAWIARLGGEGGGYAYESDVEATLDALAAHLEAHMDLEAVIRLATGA